MCCDVLLREKGEEGGDVWKWISRNTYGCQDRRCYVHMGADLVDQKERPERKDRKAQSWLSSCHVRILDLVLVLVLVLLFFQHAHQQKEETESHESQVSPGLGISHLPQARERISKIHNQQSAVSNTVRSCFE